MSFYSSIMEGICSEFSPTPMSSCDTISPYIGHYDSTLSTFMVSKPSCISVPLQDTFKINGRIDGENEKVHSSVTGVPVAEKGGVTNKKIIHKYTERQRRNEMKELYTVLRSLVPEEYIMEKRSIADQLSGTTIYVKDLRQKIKELTQQRDEMRKAKVCEALPFCASSNTFAAVEIRSVGSGVFVSTFDCQIVFSDLLLTLENNGLDIVSASCTALDEKQVYTIHAKVWNVRGFESRSLYRKVCDLVGVNSSVTKAVQS